MLGVIFGRSTFATRKILPWPGPVLRCRRSTLTSVQTCRTSTTWLQSKDNLENSFRVHGFTKDLPLLMSQPHVFRCLFGNRYFHSSAARMKKHPKPEPPPRELDLLRYDMKELRNSPKPALYLGFAGLLPFVVPTMFMAGMGNYFPELAYAQVAYGASIVSFSGGARWGFALPESSPAKPDWMNLANSVVSPLFAWLALVTNDSILPAATMVIMGLGIALHYDLSLLPTYPSWFKALRAVMTIVGFFSLIGTLVINNMYPESKLFSK